MKKLLLITFVLPTMLLYFSCKPKKYNRHKIAEAIVNNILSADTLILEMKGEPKDSVFTIVEQMPQFPGGEGEMMRYITQNLKYPAIVQEQGIQGRCTARFVVDKEGEIKDVRMLRSIDPSVDSSYVNLIKGMPKWTPGKQDGKPVAVYFTLPLMIHFK